MVCHQLANSRFINSSSGGHGKQPATVDLAAVPAAASGTVEKQISNVVDVSSGERSIVFTTVLRHTSSRNFTPPQRMQLFRGASADTDITIPHEHSITGTVQSLFSPPTCPKLPARITLFTYHLRQNAVQENDRNRGEVLPAGWTLRVETLLPRKCKFRHANRRNIGSPQIAIRG